MIIIVLTIVVLLIGILSLLLTLYGGYVSIEITSSLQGNIEQHHRSEQLYYLLGMIGIIVLMSRLLNVPLFFWMLQSLVPYCPSAMCAYGVVHAGSPYSDIALALKLFLPFVYGAWMIIEISNRKHPDLPLLRPLARTFLMLLVPLVIIDSAADVLLVTTLKPIDVPCCSSVYDVDPPFSPSTILGPQFGLLIIILTIVLSLTLITLQWLETLRPIIRIPVSLITIIVPFLYLIALHDTYAPLVLGLSTHHCPYCLFQEFPDTAFFTGLFWLGVASSGWRLILEFVWARQDLSPLMLQSKRVLLLKVSSVALLFSMVSMISHLIIAM